MAALLGLAGVVAGALALVRPAGRVGSRGAVVALAAGPAGTVIGGAILLTAEGDLLGDQREHVVERGAGLPGQDLHLGHAVVEDGQGEASRSGKWRKRLPWPTPAVRATGDGMDEVLAGDR